MLGLFIYSGVIGYFVGYFVKNRIPLFIGVFVAGIASLSVSAFTMLLGAQDAGIPLEAVLDIHQKPHMIAFSFLLSFAGAAAARKRRHDKARHKKIMDEINSSDK